MTKPATTPSTAGRPHSQGLQSVLAIVSASVDHHAHEDDFIKKLADAVATGNRDEVFAVAQRLVDVAPAVAAQTTTVEDKWLTPGEAALYANVSRMTIWRWCHERGLAFTKVGAVIRIRSSVLQKFMEEHKSG